MAAALTNQLRMLAELTPIDTGDDELLKSWENGLKVNVKGKWSKAVQRINGTPCNGLHAIAYNDINATIYVLKNFCGMHELVNEETTELLTNKLLDKSFSRNPNVWKIMSSLNKLVLNLNPEMDVNIPTIEEIRTNIESTIYKNFAKETLLSDRIKSGKLNG